METYKHANIGALKSLRFAIEQVSDTAYTKVSKPAFQSSLGQHARHIIEHYQCFLEQISSRIELNYDLRCRNIRLESERQYCLSVIDKVLQDFTSLSLLDIDVTHEDDVSNYVARSSLCRELMFLVSHTQHHNAMIAAMLRLSGLDVDDSFGVAQSTLNHVERLKNAVKKAAND